jgi:exopolyphosphatase / guanosine-5'-triphosphate,3'-diphosphate pyrophosphatase
VHGDPALRGDRAGDAGLPARARHGGDPAGANGGDLVAAIRAATGLETRVLTGEEEATYTALGVISGFFQPKGLVGDVGGGSLEVAEVVGDRVGERWTSMPLGSLPVKAMMAEGLGPAKKRIDAILAGELPPLLTEPVFYAVGGGWRAFARIHIALAKAPISAVHGYEVDAEDALNLARKIAKMTPEEVAALPDLPEPPHRHAAGRRPGALPRAAQPPARARGLLRLRPARGLALRPARPGGAVPRPAARGRPVDRPADRPGARVQRSARPLDRRPLPRRDAGRPPPAAFGLRAHRHGLARPREGPRHGELPPPAAVPLHRHHPSRTRLPRGGDHGPLRRQRRRHGARPRRGLLGPAELRRAEILGRVLLLGHRFSASVPAILDGARIRIDADAVRLEIRDAGLVPDSDAVQTRLRQLAKVCGTETAEIVTAAP